MARRGSVSLTVRTPIPAGPITLAELRECFASITGQIDLEAVGDSEIASMSFAKLITGALSGDKVMTMSGAGVILKSTNYVKDSQRFASGIINNLSKTLHDPAGSFTVADVGRTVLGDTFAAGTTVATFTDANHVELSAFPTAPAISVTVYMPGRPLGAGWALYGNGTLEANAGSVFRGVLQISGFTAHSDGTIEIGTGDNKMVASPDGSFKWGSGGAIVGITPDGTFFAGGTTFDESIFRVGANGDTRLRNTGNSDHDIDIGAIGKTIQPPVMTPSGGAFAGAVNVAMNCLTQGADIYYTDDGSEPSIASTLYEGMIPLSADTTLKAIAVKFSVTSLITTKVFTLDATQAANPQFNPVPGPYSSTGAFHVDLYCQTAGASIRYTTDGSEPTDSHGTLISPASGSTPPSGTATLSLTTSTLKAIAYKSGLTNSEVVTGIYHVSHGVGTDGGRGEV